MKKYLIGIFLITNINAETFYITPNDVNKIKKICKIAKGGDTIYLKGGEYTKKFPQIKCKGNGKYITITSFPNEIATIRSHWNIKGNYLKITNLNFKGYNNSISYKDVISHWWKTKKQFNTNGIVINANHIILKDNAIGYYPASGVKFKGKSDYITIEHNIIYNNAWWSVGGTGGLVIKNIHQIDNSKASKIKIINNLFFGNESRIFSRVFKKGFAKLVIDEGESFLIQQKDDANKKGATKGEYNGRFLVKGNIILYNGKGTSLNKANNIDLIANTLYCNGTTAKSIKAGGIRANQSNNDTFIDNAVESCKNKKAFSIKGKNNIFKNNYAKSSTQKPINGVKIVKTLFKDPKNLNFYSEYFKNRANQTLKSFDVMLNKFNIQIKPTNYIVNYQKQIKDIIDTIPKKADTKIIKLKNKIIIKNIDNRGIKGLGKNFKLLLN